LGTKIYKIKRAFSASKSPVKKLSQTRKPDSFSLPFSSLISNESKTNKKSLSSPVNPLITTTKNLNLFILQETADFIFFQFSQKSKKYPEKFFKGKVKI
jgi:hypothetical protein